ncbi:MAG: cytochrome P460 family protein [Pseudohongiellaceae bacterium]
MKVKIFSMVGVAAILSACMSTAAQLGPDASAWSDYLSWYQVTPEPTTGDPTGFLGSVHDGSNAYRQIYVNSVGQAVNLGTQSLPYPEGTILLKESFNSEAALQARRNPDLTLMIKLASGQSPETGDWEYVMGANGARRGTGDSGLGAFCRDCHLHAAAHDYNFINSAFYENNR